MRAMVKGAARRMLMATAWGRACVFDRDTRLILEAYRARHPSATALAWQPIAPAPARRYDASGAQLGDRLFLVGGYTDLEHVLPFVDVLDLTSSRWITRFAMPSAMAHHHHGLTGDGARFLYGVSGQFGPQCSPAVPTGFALDASTTQWAELPPLPEARYAPAAQLWRGRLHVMGGALPDRVTPAVEHWSLAVDGLRALEPSWRREAPIPSGGGHRSSAVVDDRLYLLGGQEGDFKAISGDPRFACTHETVETVYPDSYMLAEPGAAQWQRLPDQPVPAAHTESSTIVVGRTILVIGGYTRKDPRTYRMELTDVVQQFDTATRTWTIVGCLPYRIKTTVVAYRDRWLYAVSGQRDQDADDPRPGAIEVRAWRAPLLG